MSDPTAPVEGATTETTAPETSGPDLSAFSDRLDQLAGTVGEIHQGWQQFQQANAPEPEAEPDPWATLFGEPEPEPEPGPQLTPEGLQTAFQQALQQAQAPLMQQVQQMQLAQARQQLLAEIPELAKPEVAQSVAEQMNNFVRDNGVPQQIADWMVNQPKLIATFFKAAEAEKLAQGQAPAGEQVTALEAAGGAHPGGTGETEDPVRKAYEVAQGGALPGGFM